MCACLVDSHKSLKYAGKKRNWFQSRCEEKEKRRLLCFNDRSFEISQNLHQVWLGLRWPCHWRPQKTMSSPASSQSQPLSHRSIISKYHQTPLNRIFWGCNWSLNVIRRSEHNHLLKKATSVRSCFIFSVFKKSKETLKIEGRQLLAQSINAYGEEEQWALIQ